MNAKAWTAGDIRVLAKRTVDGRKEVSTARGAYFRALIETAQFELGGKTDQAGQLAALKAVHRRFYPVVLDAVTTADIAHVDKAPKAERRRRALERNRRSNFARSAYGTIKRWLRAPGNDLMKLDSQKVTKSQLVEESPPTRKRALTPERVHARAGKLIGSLLGFARQVAKIDRVQANTLANEAIDQLIKLVASNGAAASTTDAAIAAKEQRPLRAAGQLFIPTGARLRKTA